MSTKFNLNDDKVVVVVGSGAGGGTVGAELAMQGVKGRDFRSGRAP